VLFKIASQAQYLCGAWNAEPSVTDASMRADEGHLGNKDVAQVFALAFEIALLHLAANSKVVVLAAARVCFDDRCGPRHELCIRKSRSGRFGLWERQALGEAAGRRRAQESERETKPNELEHMRSHEIEHY
jgi:hypothetical protein